MIYARGERESRVTKLVKWGAFTHAVHQIPIKVTLLLHVKIRFPESHPKSLHDIMMMSLIFAHTLHAHIHDKHTI